MKHHGNYLLPTPDELLKDCGVDGCPKEYIYRQLQRHKQRHRNDKRHKIKRKKFLKNVYEIYFIGKGS